MAAAPLHTFTAAPVESPAFALLLALAGLASAALLGLALAALVRRRSAAHLLVALALATLLVRTAVATAALSGMLAAGTHHWLEHALDVAMAALVIAAVFTARSVRGNTGTSEEAASTDGGWRDE